MAFTKVKNKAFIVHLWVCIAIFAGVYGFCNEAAIGAKHFYHIYSNQESYIPFIPIMIVPYFSMNLLFFVPLYTLKDAREIALLSYCIITAIVIAGCIFFFFPGELGFVRTIPQNYSHVYSVLFSLDKPHNLYPSLHVAISLITFLAGIKNVTHAVYRILLSVWLLVIISSVLFTHQHHIFDVASGAVLAIVCYSAFFNKLAKGN